MCTWLYMGNKQGDVKLRSRAKQSTIMLSFLHQKITNTSIVVTEETEDLQTVQNTRPEIIYKNLTDAEKVVHFLVVGLILESDVRRCHAYVYYYRVLTKSSCLFLLNNYIAQDLTKSTIAAILLSRNNLMVGLLAVYSPV